MTAKVIHLELDRKFSQDEIDAIVAVAEDKYCPEIMTTRFVDLAIRVGRAIRENGLGTKN